MAQGLIKSCKSAGCGWICCDFGSDGHIVILPSEKEKVAFAKHLKMIDENYNGGMKAKCIAKNKTNCDNGYKPIQCKTFPLFVRGNGMFEKSTRCPLRADQIKIHMSNIREQINFESLDKEFLDKAELNSYKNI